MSNSDESLKQDPILKAIAELSAKFDSFEKSTNRQFEVIREGLAHNTARFD